MDETTRDDDPTAPIGGTEDPSRTRTTPDAEPDPRLAEVPSKIHEFEVHELLGRGGMGSVYRAFDASLERDVALKILPTTSCASGLARFEREAKAIARLKHPRIVPVYRVGEWRGINYIAMEYVRGVTLADRLRDERRQSTGTLGRRYDPDRGREVVGLVAEVADALEHAHRHGIVHRDVKPSNILLDSEGSPHLADFGLAKDLGQQTLSEPGSIAGTLRYMCPEQADPLSGELDARADVYSLGVVLYESLSLQLPLAETSVQAMLSSILNQEPQPLSSKLPGVPRDLEVICHKAMEKDPANRYQSAGHFAADLRSFALGHPILARPPSAIRRFRRWVAAHRVQSLVLTILILAAVAGTLAAREVRREQARFSRVTISADRPGVEVQVREFDSETLEPGTAVPVGTAPVLNHRLLPGHYRFVLIAPGGDIAETTEFITTPGKIRIEASIRPTPEVVSDMVLIPAGSCLFGRVGVDRGIERERRVDHESFWIDTTEVSNAAYLEFMQATGSPGPAYLTPDVSPHVASLPVVGITLLQARRYAEWRGKRLPTLLEWECAARAPDGRRWPWGDGPPPEAPQLTVDALWDSRSNDPAVLRRAYLEHSAPVQSHPLLATPLDLHHMFGNVKEFTESVFYSRSNACIIKGSAWADSPVHSDVTRTRTYPTGNRSYQVGFRCAKSTAP